MRGLTGIEVDSLFPHVSTVDQDAALCEMIDNLHIITGEELLQFGLGGRISEIPDVQTTTLGSRSQDTLVGRGVINAGVLEVVGKGVDGRRHCG